MSVTSDNLSSKIVTLRDAISASDVLWSNTALRNKVCQRNCQHQD